MIPAIVVFAYLALVLYVGVFAFRRGKESSEDFFVASRSLGPYVFLFSLFGTNMTAFAILGSSGLAYQRGIGVFGLMASSSGLVIPLTIFIVGTRLWGLGKRFGHITQVQFLRDRWECSAIGTVIFVLTAAMLVPYIVIGVMGGGHTLETVTSGFIPYWLGGAIVAVVVMSYVFFGGMRGTAWVNTLQTILFLAFGTLAFLLISRKIGGFDEIMSKLAADPKTTALLTRQRIPMAEFFSYTFIPLSAIMFPHIAIMCMTAERVTHFKKTVIAYPICILMIWLPSVLLGVVAASQFPGLRIGESDDVILRLLATNTDAWLAGILGAAIMACVMATDSQILALSTMFTQDIFAYYGGHRRFGERVQVWTGRLFVVGVTLAAYFVALQLKDKEGIFELAIRFAFSGFAALCPIMLAALFWRRSTKWGALAASLWVAANVVLIWYLHDTTAGIAPKPGQPFVQIYPALGDLLVRSPGNVLVFDFLPVFPMVLGSALLMIVVSLVTPPPSAATIDKYFPKGKRLVAQHGGAQHAAAQHGAQRGAPQHGVAQLEGSVPNVNFTVAQTQAAIDGVEGLQLVDVRTQKEWNDGYIRSAIHIPVDDLEARMGQLDRSRPILTYCAGGVRSARALKLLERHGYNVIGHLASGIRGWRDAGGEIVKPK